MTAPTFLLPPLDWSISLPETLEFHGKHNPDVPLFVLARHGSDKSPSVTYGQFVRACRRVPRSLGLSKEDVAARPVIALLANTDTLIYHTIILGLVLVGAIPFPISQRNTAEGVTHLIRTASCWGLILTAETLPKLAPEVIQDLSAEDIAWSSRIYDAPLLSQLYPELISSSVALDDRWTGDKEYPIFKPDFTDTCIYKHSSGSTGLPKAMKLAHHEVISYMKYTSSTVFRRQNPRIMMACMELPPYHGMSFVFQLCVPLMHGASICIPFPTVLAAHDVPMMVDPETVIRLIESTKANACFTFAAFMNGWARDEHHVEILKNLDFVGYAGGALPTEVGDELVNKGVKLRLLYGGSEFGGAGLSSMRPGDEKEWAYIEFAEESHPHLVPQGDGTFQVQFISPSKYPRSVTNIPGVNGYATTDLMRPHPTKSHLWKPVGRIDDVIVHSSGEKTVPNPIELIIQGSPYVHDVVVFGVGRMQPGLLIELKEEYAIDVQDALQVSAMRNLLWPTVEAANKIAPAFSKIFKEMILFTSRDKPLPRTPKQTIMKKAAWALYAEEIDDIYTFTGNNLEHVSPPQSWTEADLSQWLVNQIDDLGLNKNIKPKDNLFENGFDSLGNVILRQRIIRAIQSSAGIGEAAIPLNLVYKYPSISALAKHLANAIDVVEADASESINRITEIDEMIAKYSFSGVIKISQENTRRPRVVLITGSTGGLGSHILEKLLRNSDVKKVYTLNRSDSRSTISERHQRRFEDRGLDKQLLLLPTLVHIESAAEEPNLGLTQDVYDEIKNSVDLIIHVAWKMNFNHTLHSFESNIRATHNLASLARASPKAGSVRLLFTSSVGVAKSWDQSLGLYPERLIMDTKYAVGGGYGEAKYICERILATSGLDTTSVRIGQITGSDINGAWSPSDWVPIIFQSSVALGALPTTQGNISWLSADAVASTILDVVFYHGRLPQVLNMTHPNPITWDTMVQHVREVLSEDYGISLPIVYFSKWFASLLEAASISPTNASQMPALKLIDFFHSLNQGAKRDPVDSAPESFSQPVFETGACRTISKSLDASAPISKDDMSKWVRYWGGKHIFG